MDVSILAGFILPPVVDLINKRISNSKVKFLVSLGICVLVGAVFHLKELTNATEILKTISLVFAESQVIYKMYWEKSSIREKML